jgi:hypothetical protein
MGWDDLAGESADEANRKLADREKQLLVDTGISWDDMKPKIGSEEDYQKLMKVVGEATAKNESLGAFFERLEKLGTEGYALAKKVRDLIPT